jgi:hypothetical protein
MKYYRLITNKEWQELQKPLDNSLTPHSDNPFPQKVIETTEFKKVKYQYNQHLNEIVQYCVKYQEECQNLYSTLEKLGLYYGTNTYNKDDIKVTAALIEALSSERAILLEKPVEYHSGLLPPQNNFLKLPSNRIPRRLTASEIQARQLAQYDNEENYIEFTVYNLANQPFTIFDNTSQKMLKQGTLDSSGYAYVSLPVNAQYVDIVFDKQQTDRPWYYDVPLQLLGGIRDAG